ncbi:MAG: hypothetical protein Q8O09_00865, partial [Bacillota bacterium]|nr:hypothetical protein [Bacillota bacterium]
MGENSAGKKTLLQVRTKDLALLNVLFLIYSFVAVCQKFAFNNGKNELFSAQFFLFIGIAFVLLAVYALLWQQVLKRVPLSVAYSNKGITLLWGLLWGFV